MADSGSLRTRRYRLHRAGDHSLCKRCAGLRGPVAPPAGQEGRDLPADDLGKLRWLAGQLAEAYRADPGNALLARELRMTLQALMPQKGSQADDELGDLFAAFSAS